MITTGFKLIKSKLQITIVFVSHNTIRVTFQGTEGTEVSPKLWRDGGADQTQCGFACLAAQAANVFLRRKNT